MERADEIEALRARWIEYAASVAKPRACVYEDCEGTRIAWNGSRVRGASVLLEGHVVHLADLPCRRAKCGVCKRSWTLRPPGMVPHKHYQPCVAARAVAQYVAQEQASLEQVARRHGCSRRTVARWVAWVAALVDPAVVLSKIVEVVDAPLRPSWSPWTRVLERARPLVRRAAEVLGLLEDLASAWRLEPPGLRAVLERVVGDHSGVATYARPLIPEFARGPPG